MKLGYRKVLDKVNEKLIAQKVLYLKNENYKVEKH